MLTEGQDLLDTHTTKDSEEKSVLNEKYLLKDWPQEDAYKSFVKKKI